jgi:16S rRNA (cytidine1402-2'-O)-methyltransferase
MPGTLFLVATPIGNLEDITARALRVLGEVALIAAEDTRRTSHLLSRYAITTPTTSLHEHNEVQKTPSLIARLQAGDSIALVSDAGTPLMSDPGQHLVQGAIEAGIRVEPIPGPSAIVAALSASGFPTKPFAFLGFPPARGKDRKEWLATLAASSMTVVFFESPHRIRQTLEEILTQIGDLEVVVCRELTKMHEELVRGPISAIHRTAALDTGELTVVANVGQRPNKTPIVMASDQEIAIEIGRVAETLGIPRRQAIRHVAKKHGRRPNDIYEAFERSKQSVKSQK